ncbi:MAG: sulfite exporter TauE/SafE family protein [Betaproteobacteria bacterium]|nr:MAG: sulfite exporter TauE/SafE family protein [Betaproteobacteria bacterium]
MPVAELHEPATLALVGAILWFAFFVRGISGFGSATVAIPLLAHVTPLKLAVPLLLVLDFAATLATLKIDRGLIEKREVRRLLPFAIVGVIAGATLLVRLPAAWLLGVLGALVVFYGVRTLLQPGAGRPVSTLWAAPAGFTGGLLGGMFGSGAATPYMIYLTRRLHDRRRVRATFTGFAFFDYGFRLITFAIAGLLLDRTLGVLLLLGLPAMALGLYAGNLVHHRISNEKALRFIGVLLVLSGASLLAKSWQ